MIRKKKKPWNLTSLTGQLHPRLRHSSMLVEKFLLAIQTPFLRFFSCVLLRIQFFVVLLSQRADNNKVWQKYQNNTFENDNTIIKKRVKIGFIRFIGQKNKSINY